MSDLRCQGCGPERAVIEPCSQACSGRRSAGAPAQALAAERVTVRPWHCGELWRRSPPAAGCPGGTAGLAGGLTCGPDERLAGMTAWADAMAVTIQPHILVVDDDPGVRALLTDYFTENALRVSTAGSGTAMAEILRESAIDLIVLDVRLAGENGMSIARALRSESAIPIIMLTGVREEADRVMGLELGADDYITKPFSPRELLARIRTILRRARPAAAACARDGQIRAFRFGDFEFNLRTRRLAKTDGTRIDLTNGEFNLLAALLARPQHFLSRDQLIEASRVYDNEVYDRAIDVQILRLRRKIEPDCSQPRYIVTERGVGYSFSAPVETVY